MMKHLRFASLLATFTLLLMNPAALRAAECCEPFNNHCDSFCDDHGGVMITNCGGLECSDACWCWDVDPETEQHYNDYHEEPYCSGGSCQPPI